MGFVSLAYKKQEKVRFASPPDILRANIGKACTCHIKFRRSNYGRGRKAAIVAVLAVVKGVMGGGDPISTTTKNRFF